MERSTYRTFAVILAVVQGLVFGASVWRQLTAAEQKTPRIMLASQLAGLASMAGALFAGRWEGNRAGGRHSPRMLRLRGTAHVVQGAIEIVQSRTARD